MSIPVTQPPVNPYSYPPQAYAGDSPQAQAGAEDFDWSTVSDADIFAILKRLNRDALKSYMQDVSTQDQLFTKDMQHARTEMLSSCDNALTAVRTKFWYALAGAAVEVVGGVAQFGLAYRNSGPEAEPVAGKTANESTTPQEPELPPTVESTAAESPFTEGNAVEGNAAGDNVTTAEGEPSSPHGAKQQQAHEEHEQEVSDKEDAVSKQQQHKVDEQHATDQAANETAAQSQHQDQVDNEHADNKKVDALKEQTKASKNKAAASRKRQAQEKEAIDNRMAYAQALAPLVNGLNQVIMAGGEWHGTRFDNQAKRDNFVSQENSSEADQARNRSQRAVGSEADSLKAQEAINQSLVAIFRAAVEGMKG